MADEPAKLHLCLQLPPITRIPARTPRTILGISNGIRSSEEHRPYCELGIEGSRLHPPYENHPETPPDPHPGKDYLPQNWSLVPKMLGTAVLGTRYIINPHTRVVESGDHVFDSISAPLQPDKGSPALSTVTGKVSLSWPSGVSLGVSGLQ